MLLTWFALAVGAMLLGGCGNWDQSTHRSDVPLSYTDARKAGVKFVPAGASNIHYLFHAGGLQEYWYFVCFDVAQGNVDAAIADLIFQHDRATGVGHAYKRDPIHSGTQHITPQAKFLPMSWWDTASISTGYALIGEAPGQHSIKIWVDSGAGRIYVQQND